MPLTDFQALPGDARVWVFAADAPLTDEAASLMLEAVDEFLASWHAHGHPLTSARDFRDNRFLAIGVDQSTEGASGCSIDGLFRIFKDLQARTGGNLFPGSRIFWRADDGTIRSGTRAEFSRDAHPGTRVFDTTISSADAWREAFELEAQRTWHQQLLAKAAS